MILVDFDFGGSVRDKWRQLISSIAVRKTGDLVDPLVRISLAGTEVKYHTFIMTTCDRLSSIFLLLGFLVLYVAEL